MYHPGAPPNNDVPYSWSPDRPYFVAPNQNCPKGSPSGYTGTTCNGCPSTASDTEFIDWQIANATVGSLRIAAAQRQASGRPFFVAAGFHRPHVPWYIPQRFVDMYPPQLPPKFPNWADGQPPCAFSIGEDAAGSNFTVTRPVDPGTASVCRRLYYAAVSSVDHHIGMVLDELVVLSLVESTAVVLIGDHGYALGEGNQWAKYAVTEFGTRVPLILRAPWLPYLRPQSQRGSNVHELGGFGQSEGVVTAATLAELLDVYPTLATLAMPGVQLPSGLEGVSLLPALLHPANTSVRSSAASQFAHMCCHGLECPTGPPIATTVCPNRQPPTTPTANLSFMGYAVRTVAWRYVEWHAWNGTTLRPDCGGPMAVELYPHAGDAGTDFDAVFETSNTAATASPSVLAGLRAELTARFASAFAACP